MPSLRSLGGFSAVIAAAVLGLTPGAAAKKWTPPPEYAIKPSPNGRYWQETDGTPFWWQADTAWLLTHRLNMDEVEEYLRDRASKGFTVVLNVGFTQEGITSPNRAGDLTFHGEDINKPNEAYWSYIDSVVQLAWEKYKIRMALIPAWGQYAHGDGDSPSLFTADNSTGFGEFIGQRYPHLPKFIFPDTDPIWGSQADLVQDFEAGGIQPPHPTIDWTPIWNALAEGIVAGERKAVGDKNYNPTLSIHPRNQWFPTGPIALATTMMGEDTPWLTFDASQSGHVYLDPHCPTPWWNAKRGWECIEAMYNISSAGTPRPVVDNEAHYEERFDTEDDLYVWNASDVRTGSWQSAFSGAAGITYGDDNVMQMYVEGVYDPAGSGHVAPWNVSLHAPAASQMQYIKKALLDRGTTAFFNRVPAQDIIVGDSGTDDLHVTAIRDSKNSFIMVYTPTGAPFTINTSSLSGKVKASWFNPVSGTYTSFNVNDATGPKKAKVFTPPKANNHADWTLVLECK